MNFFKYILLTISLIALNFGFSQITGNGVSTTQNTQYTDGSVQDVIYIYCIEPGTSASIGSLTATPPTGAGGPFDFEWYQYNTGTNSFDSYSTTNNQGSSTITNLPSGGYSVSITNNSGAVVGCYRTWVFNNETNIDAGNIGASCGGFNLNGIVDPIADFVYYNPPPDQFIIDASTEITVCFDATHTFLSDLGFFLISPAGTQITLSPNPGSLGQLQNCNSDQNLVDLCFTSNNINNNLNACTENGPWSGTFDEFGPNPSTVIDWSPLYGQDAAQSGWAIQIFDCINLDFGFLTNANLTFTGNSVCGPDVINYDSGNINSAINDNSCTSALASIYVVPQNIVLTTPIVLANTIVSFEWTDDNPCVTIPNATTSLNPAIASTPTMDTWFYLTATDNFGCEFTDSVQFIRDCPCATNSPFLYLGANLSGPDCTAGTFGLIDGEVQFDEGLVPCTGTLTISNCSGDNVVFNAPFTSPILFTIPDIVADGTTNCSFEAQFSDDPENCIIDIIYTEPDCPCSIDSYNISVGNCQPNDNSYDLTGTIEFTNPPTTGTLNIVIDNGTTTYDTIINAINFISPLDFSISGVDSDGAATSITATFSADGGCTTTMSYTSPDGCYCSADIGTFVASDDNVTNSDFVLCFGDSFTYDSNNDYTAPDDIGANDPTIPLIYNPGIAYLIYSCPPTPGMTPDASPTTGDPCLEGLVSVGNGALAINDLNNLGWINAFPPNTFTDNIIYYVPVTMYDIDNLWYSVAIEPCYDLGPAIAVQYLPEMKFLDVEDCQAGTITTSVTGGLPELDGSNFNIVPGSLTPANASFDNTSATNGGTITISGLTNGQPYQYSIIDDNNCPIIISGIFTGTEDPGFSYNNSVICTAGTDPIVSITGDAGTFSFVLTSGVGTGPTLSINTTTGAIDVSASDPGTYDITYTTNDVTCFSDSTVSMTINLTPIVDLVSDQTVCADSDFSAVNFTGTAGAAFTWANNNTAIGLGANGTGDVLAFTAINATAAQISATITVTPTLGTCVGTPITFDYIVDPLDNPGFLYPSYTYCSSELDPTATVDAAGGAFTFVATSGGPTLVINAVTGLIDLSATDAGTYDITYTTAGACPQDSTITMNVAATPTVDPVLDQTVCQGTDFALTDFTGSVGTVFNWVNDNTAIGLVANGTNDIAAFTSTNTSGAQISATITVTPVAGTCTGVNTTFDLIVNTLDIPGFSYPAYTYCTSELDPIATIDVAGGAFTFTVINGGPTLVINAVTGLIDLSSTDAGSYDITYTTTGICPQDSTITMNIAATPTVDPVLDQTICDGADFALIDFTGSAGSTFNWANDNTAIGLVANGTNDISAFTATNGTAVQISATITVTPVAGTCNGTLTTFNLSVNPLDNSGFSYPNYIYCTTDANPTAIIDAAGGVFTSVATSGGPNLVINAGTGLIDLATSDEGVYDIMYTTTGLCVQDSTVSVMVNFTPTVDPVLDQTVCDGTDFTTVAFTGTAGLGVTTYDWTNDNVAIGLVASGNGDVTAFTGANSTGLLISGLMSVTPSTPNCTGTPTIFNLIVDPLENPGFSYPTNSYCSSEVDPTATIDVPGGVFSFTATNGGPILAINLATGLIDLGASSPGTYDITYTTVGPCPQDSTITMNIASTPTVNAIVDQTVCPLSGDEFNTVFISGSVGSTFNWDNDNTAIGLVANGTGNIASFLGVNAGITPVSATITVTPVAGSCTGPTTDFTFIVNPLDNPTFSYPAYVYCTADVLDPIPTIDIAGGGFTSTAIVGTGNLSLDAGTGLIDLDASDAGTYEITYTTVGLCPQNLTLTMVINLTPVVNTIVNDTVCENLTFNAINFVGTAGTTFDWVNDNVLIGLNANGTGNISSFSGLTSGGIEISTITVTPTLGTCAGSDSTFQLVVNPLGNPGFNYPSSTYCTADIPDAIPVIDVVGGVFTYLALNGSPLLSINSTTGVIDLNNSDEGVYDVTYTTTGVCPQSSTVTITINLTPTINTVSDQSECHDNSFVDINFSGTGATSYSWTNSDVSIGLGANGVGDIIGFTAVNSSTAQVISLITVTPLTATCTGIPVTFNLTVDVLDDPSFQYDTGLTYCQTGANPIGNITGAAGGVFSYTVNNGGPILDINSTTGDVNLLTSDPGSYDITYKTPLINACPQQFTLTFVITSAPVADFSFLTYCENDGFISPEYDFDDDGNPFIPSGSGGTTWSASPSAGLVINPVTGIIDINASSPGTYTVTNVIDIAGCLSDSHNDDVTINPLPEVMLSDSYTICPLDPFTSIEVIATGTIIPPNTQELFTIIFEYNGVVQSPILGAPSPLNLPNLGLGTYEVVSVHDGFCTNIVSEVTVVDTFIAPILSPILNYSICEGSDLTIDPFSGIPAGNTYEWSLGTDIGFGVGPNTSPIGTFTASNSNVLPYTVNVTPYSSDVTTTSPNGCVGTVVSFDIVVNPLPTLDISANVFNGCVPTVIEFTNLVNDGQTYDWTFGNGASGSGISTSYTYEEGGVYDVGLTVTNAFGCTASDMEIGYITITTMPVADFSLTPQITVVSHTDIEFTNESTNADEYIWDFGDETELNYDTDPTHTYADIPNQYPITLWALNNNGVCRDSIQQFVTINDILLYYIPNVFTPDQDAFNETFKPIFTSGFDPFDYHLVLFNRWGEIIFESYDTNFGWDGTYPEDGELCADGVYIWKISFKETMSDKRHDVTGHVSLLK